jgi:hypothetical protein
VDEADAYIVGNRKLVVVKGVCTNFTALPSAWVSAAATGDSHPPAAGSHPRQGDSNDDGGSGGGSISAAHGSFDPPYMPLAGAAPMASAASTVRRKGFEQARLFPGPDGLLHMIGHDHGDNAVSHYISTTGAIGAADWHQLSRMPSFGLATNEATPVFDGVPGDKGGVPTHFIQFAEVPATGKLAVHLLAVGWVNQSAVLQ